MSKLFNLKEWLTVADAARHLSIVFGEEVTEADVLRLALDGRLRLSVHFVNHAHALCGKVVGYEDVEWKLLPSHNGRGIRLIDSGEGGSDAQRAPAKLEALIKSIPLGEVSNWQLDTDAIDIDGERFLELSDQVTTLRGVWDLPMIGNERLDIEHQYQSLTCGPSVTLTGLVGTFVEGRDGQICQLQENPGLHKDIKGLSAALGVPLEQHFSEPDTESAAAAAALNRRQDQRERFLECSKATSAEPKFIPAGGLPEDAVIVVRTEALREFEESVNGGQQTQEKPLSTQERNSLLTIIAALCDYSAIKLEQRGSANRIARMTEEIGAPVSDDTVRRLLKKIPDGIESRMK